MYVHFAQKGDILMAENTNSASDVLQSDHHAKLSAEEIAKALARHNRHHSAAAAPGPSSKPKSATKH
jgi:hypothetical protein